MAFLLSPSILSADFGKLQEQIEIINNSNADLIHIDVMDGVFVPNISFGFTVLDSIIKYIKKPLDIHLMIVEPEKYIERFAIYKPEYLTVHLESCLHLNRMISHIQSFGIKAGIALNPHSSVFLLQEIISDADLVLVMSVNPGYGGQEFIKNTLQKIIKTKELITKNNSRALLEVDGGININNIKQVVGSGADIIVAGNAVFGSENITDAINQLKNCS
jgi:ribulose-phosphate 3-epimerase